MIDLYTWTTPNGRKISIALEEMGLPYTVHSIDISNDEQFSADFLAISPNNKIPAIVDVECDISIFESAAILIYLAEKSGQFLSTKPEERVKTIEWVSWQTAGLGPTLGHLNFFVNRAESQIPEAIKRFTDETLRLFKVLDTQLSQNGFVAGDYSIADMAVYPWSSAAYKTIQSRTGVSFMHIEAWQKTVAARPAVIAGMSTPYV
jgi:GST-like protein